MIKWLHPHALVIIGFGLGVAFGRPSWWTIVGLAIAVFGWWLWATE